MRCTSLLLAGFLALSATSALAADKGSDDFKCGVYTKVPADEYAAKMQARAEDLKQKGYGPSEPDASGQSGFRKPNEKLFLVSLDDKQRCSQTKDGRCEWGVERPFVYQVRGTQDLITVPPGFTTDLASIPSIAWPFLPPDGPWLKAAVVHDFLYKTCGKGQWKYEAYAFTRKGCTADKECYPRDEADKILRDAMEDRGVGPVKRAIIYMAVHLFGGSGWGT
jgi:hypothetical protein